VAVDDNAGGVSFAGVEAAVFVVVQKMEHGFQGGAAIAIREDGGMQPERVALLEIVGHERFSVNEIIGAHTAAHKSNDD
jgi:hypothetical protein